MLYPTKIDPLLGIAMVLPIILLAGLGTIILISQRGPASVGWILLMASLGVLVLLFLVAWPVNYDPSASGADGEPILLVCK